MHYYESEDFKRFADVGKFRTELMKSFFNYYNKVTGEDGALSRREKALIALAVAHAKQCPYCIDDYMTKLVNAFNPAATQGVMCRNLVSVGYDGRLYDCDFNQMMELQIINSVPLTVFNFDHEKLTQRRILFAAHCFGCTAGAGSSCGGSTT